MDDPTRRCENDAGIETPLPGLLNPSGSPSFFPRTLSRCTDLGLARFGALAGEEFGNGIDRVDLRD